VACWPIG